MVYLFDLLNPSTIANRQAKRLFICFYALISVVTCFRMIHINVSDILNIQMSHLSGSIIYVQCSLPLIELSHFIKADFHTKTFISVDSYYGKYIYIHYIVLRLLWNSKCLFCNKLTACEPDWQTDRRVLRDHSSESTKEPCILLA